MAWTERLSQRLGTPAARRWGAVSLGAALAHLLVFGLLAPTAELGRYGGEARQVAPIFIELTPRAREPRPLPDTAPRQSGAPTRDLPPIAVRPATDASASPPIEPLVVETPPVRPSAPGRIIPQSWRTRCGLPAQGPVSDADWRACERMFLNAATPTDPPRRRRGDPAQDFAAQGAARIAAYDARRAPTPVGGGLARPSSTPGSNFGMGDMDASVTYMEGARPDVRGGID